MEKSEIQEKLQSYFSVIEEGSLNSIVKYSSFLKSITGTKLISEGERHNWIKGMGFDM